MWESRLGTQMFLVSLRYGLVVRIAGSHPAGPGSIPGNGIPFLDFVAIQKFET